MESGVYKFTFRENIPVKEIEECLFWSCFNTESIFGKARFRLDSTFYFDRHSRVVVIDKSTDVGKHLAQLFASVVAREFGDEAFRIERLLAKGFKSPAPSQKEGER